MTAKELETKMFALDEKRMGSRNMVVDMLSEVATALDFDMTLLKSNMNKDKTYNFADADYDAFVHFMDAAKSKEGKRLRCKDYVGATGSFIEKMQDFFMMLAEHNGVDQEILDEQWLKMQVATDCEILRSYLREITTDFEEDIEKFYFRDNYNTNDIFCDDHIDGVRKYVFLSYMIGNVDAPIEEIRGVYWFYKMHYEQITFDELKLAGEYIRSLSPIQKKQYKEHIRESLHYECLIEKDDQLGEMINKWNTIEEGGGKLQDMKKQKGNLIKILERQDDYAKKIFAKITDELPAMQGKAAISLKNQYMKADKNLLNSMKEYRQYLQERKQCPMTEQNERLFEIEFRQRFGSCLCNDVV